MFDLAVLAPEYWRGVHCEPTLGNKNRATYFTHASSIPQVAILSVRVCAIAKVRRISIKVQSLGTLIGAQSPYTEAGKQLFDFNKTGSRHESL